MHTPTVCATLGSVKLLLENLPPSLRGQADTIRRCLEAFDREMPLQAVYLFGSHARGEAQPDSDVDLCLVSEGAERQLEAGSTWWFHRSTGSQGRRRQAGSSTT